MKNIKNIPRLKFEPELEDAYNAYTAQSTQKYIRAAYAIFAVLYALFSTTDYILVPQWFSLFFAIRFYIVIPVFVLTFILTFHPNFYKWMHSVVLAGLIIGGTGIAVMLVLEPLNTIYYGGLFLVFTAGYFLLNLHAAHAVLGGSTILAAFIAGVLWTGGMSLGVFSAALFLIAENIIGGIGAYQLERYRRNEFLQVHNLNQARAQLQNALAERNRYLEAILRTSADGFWVVDAGKRLTQVNDAYCRMSGYSRDEFQQLTLNDIDAEETPEETMARSRRIMEKGSEVFEARHRRKDGRVFDVEVSVTFLNIDGGQFVCFCRDITGRKQAEDRIKSLLAGKELLLKEVHHRIKNNLSTVSSLLALQARSASPEAKISFEAAINRVNSMVLLYDKLQAGEQYDSISCKGYLEDIIETLKFLFNDDADVRVETRVDDFNLTTKKLFPLGIIVNEIITNIMKYAFIGRESGKISISLVRSGNTATLSIRDDGVGLPDGFDMSRSTGFGLMLVGILAEQMEGKFTMKNDSGTRSVLVFSI
jgi:PAS domain S-box-containing protein